MELSRDTQVWEQGDRGSLASDARLSERGVMGGEDSATQKALLCVVFDSLRDTRQFLENVCVAGMKMRGLCSVQVLLALSAAPLSPFAHAEASLHLLLLFFTSLNLNHSLETRVS